MYKLRLAQEIINDKGELLRANAKKNREHGQKRNQS